MKIKHTTFILIIAIASFCLACNNQSTCIPQHSDLLEISFVDQSGKAKEIKLVSVNVQGSNANFPSIKDSVVTTLSLPLNPLDTSIILSINSDTAINDLAFSYKVLPVLIAPECGIETKFDFLKIESTNFKNVIVINQTLNKDIETNVEITH